jgi:O-methyltransferase involved in polyketide biosynthesis
MRSSRPANPTVLHGVERSLFIPLIVRAQAASWCAMLDPQDCRAHAVLARSGESTQSYPTDLPTAINILWRTCTIKTIAGHFFEQHTCAQGANLGAGLTDYFQWLDNGSNHWLDVDLPEVIALRQQLLPAPGARHKLLIDNLRQPGWWKRLHLHRHPSPLLLICEGVLMYMQPDEVAAFFREIGEQAPAGTELVCDFISPWGIGQTIPANRHPGDATAFTWGTCHAQDMTRFHARLHLLAEHSVAQAYGWCGTWLEALWAPVTGGPLYGLAHLQVMPRP